MPYTVEWLHEGKIILARTHGAYTIEDVEQCSAQYIDMFEQSQNPPVHIVGDFGNLTQFPANFLLLREKSTFLKHPSLGWQVYFGKSTFATSVIKVFAGVTNMQFTMLDNYDEAITFLKSKDKTINIP